MPTYSYRNKKTGKTFDKVMTMAEMDAYEAANPNIQREYQATPILDPSGMGIQKPSSDFSKYVLGKVKATNPLGNVGERRWSVPREW